VSIEQVLQVGVTVPNVKENDKYRWDTRFTDDMTRTDRRWTDTRSPLWVERAAAAVGANEAVERLTGKDGTRWGPYLLLWSVIFLDAGVLSGIQYARNGFHPVLANPGWLLLFPVGLSFVVYASRRLRADYRETTSRLASATTVPDPDELAFERVVSRRFERSVFLLLLVSYTVWLVAQGHLLPFIWTVEGPVVGSVKWFVIVPFVYVRIAADFGAIALGVNVRLPHRVAEMGVEPEFGSLRDRGGFNRLGQLVGRTTRYYFVCFALYTLSTFTYLLLGGNSPYPSPGLPTVAAFAVLWAAGVGSFLYPVLVLHWHVRAAKRRALDRVTRRLIRDDGPPAETAHDVTRHVRLHAKLACIERAGEYPVDAPTVRRFVAAAGLVLLEGAVTYAVFPALAGLFG